MIFTLKTLRLCLLAALLATPALAEDDPEFDNDLEAEAALLQGAQLEDRGPAGGPILADPSPDQLKSLEKVRAEVEKLVNGLQADAQKFTKTQEHLTKINQMLLKAFDAYLAPHNERVEAYRAALKAKDAKAEAKLAKEISKMRESFLKDLGRVRKEAEALQKEIGVLSAKAAKEDAEDAAAIPPEPATP